MKPARFTFLSNVVLFLHMEIIAQGNGVPAWGHVSAAAFIIPVWTYWLCMWSDENVAFWNPICPGSRGAYYRGCLFQRFLSRFDLDMCVFILPLKHAINSLEQKAHEVYLPASMHQL